MNATSTAPDASSQTLRADARASPRAPTVLGLTLRPILAAASALGIDVDGLCAAMDIPLPALAAFETRLARSKANELLSRLSALAGEVPLALVAADMLRLGDLGLLDLLPSSAATLRDATAWGGSLLPLVLEGSRIELREIDGLSHGTLVEAGEPLVLPIHAELVFAGVSVLLQRITGRDLRLAEVRFAHRRADPRPYERFFGTTVVFGGEQNECLLPRALLDLALPGANPHLAQALEAYAKLLAERTSPALDLAELAALHVRELLAEGDCTLEGLAARLGTGKRTLQRRLADAGTSHQAILDDVRRAFALCYLREGAYSVDRVARSLGFADPSAFSRAFRRWTNVSATEFRRRPSAFA